MKRINAIFFAAAAAAFSLVSCSRENITPAEKSQGELVTVHFGAESSIDATKATLTTADETTFTSAWENGDVLSVEYMNENDDAGIVDAIWQSSSKSFDATLPLYTGMWTYDAVYPAPASDRTIDFGSSRIQDGNVYNCKYDLMSGSAVAGNAAEGKDDKGNDIIFEMDRQTAIAYFHLTSELDEDVVSATLSVEGGNSYIATKSAKLADYAKGYELAADATNGLKDITIKFEGKAPEAKDFQLWFNVLPTVYDKMTLTVETTGHTMSISRTSEEDTYEAGKLYKVVKEIPADKWVAKPVPADTKELVFGFKSSFPTGWPTNKDAAKAGTYNYTIDDVAYSFVHGDGIYCGGKIPNSGYLFIAKNKSLGLPAIKGFKLVKVIGTLNDSGTPSTQSVVCITDGTDVVTGGTGQTWKTKGADYTYTLTGTEENTMYYMSVTEANCQILSLKLFYETAAPSVQSCSTPVITLDGAVATITCATEGATIHYTLDGTDPTADDDVYSSPVTLTDGQTIKAIAVKDGMKDSAVASAKYAAGAVGETKVSTLTLSSKNKFGTTTGSTLKADDNIVWTVNTTSKKGAIQNSYNTSYCGQQFGTAKAAWTGSFDADFSGKQISKIEIAANTGGTATVSATVGNSEYGKSVSVEKKSGVEVSYTFEGLSSGKISIVVSGTSAAFYLGKIKVTYTE